MHRYLHHLMLLTLLLAGAAGCKPVSLRPERPEEFRLPPEDDPRFSRIPQIPKEHLNPNKPRNPFEKDDFTPPAGMSGAGGMPMGRPGGI